MQDFLAKIKEFIKTPLGKVVLVALILLVVLFVVALAVGVFFVFGSLRSEPQAVPKAPVEVRKSTESPKVTKEDTEEDQSTSGKTSEEDSAAYEVYEYKDPFEPVIKEETTSTPSTPTTPSEEETSTPSAPAEQEEAGEGETGSKVLEVQDIFTENGVKYSSIKYGATVYKVKEGDRVDESPYEVLTIGSDSVVLLFGDSRVEVKVGESILK